MSETRYEHRTDGVEQKLQLLREAHRVGDYDVALSLAESIKDTLTFDRLTRAEVAEPVVKADVFGRVADLPAVWRAWARGWGFFKVVTLDEPIGLDRSGEPVDVAVGFRADQATDLGRELRVARCDAASGTLDEVPSQVVDVTRRDDQYVCRAVFAADVPAHGQAHYVIFYGNPHAERPAYMTDLATRGEGTGLDITNQHYSARLSRQTGQLERLTYKRVHDLELFAGTQGHGEPPHIDWAHDYVSSNRFQKLRVTNWSRCPNWEVVRGPLCVQVRRWGFPHSPIHPLFTPSRLHMSVTYTFFAGLPYFLKHGRMQVVKDMDITYLRDDEWLFMGHNFTDALWLDGQGQVHEGDVDRDQQDEMQGGGFFHRQNHDAFIALWLEHRADGFDGLHRGAVPQPDYSHYAQIWSRWAARDNPHFTAGTSLWQKNAYFVGAYTPDDGAAVVQDLRRRLLNPVVAHAGTSPDRAEVIAPGALARTGEADVNVPLKQAVWQALREVRDGQLYAVDANVVDMGYIYDVCVRGDVVRIVMTMPHRGRPKYRFIGKPIRRRLLELDGVRDVHVEFTWEPAWTPARLTDGGRRAMGLSP